MALRGQRPGMPPAPLPRRTFPQLTVRQRPPQPPREIIRSDFTPPASPTAISFRSATDDTAHPPAAARSTSPRPPARTHPNARTRPTPAAAPASCTPNPDRVPLPRETAPAQPRGAGRAASSSSSPRPSHNQALRRPLRTRRAESLRDHGSRSSAAHPGPSPELPPSRMVSPTGRPSAISRSSVTAPSAAGPAIGIGFLTVLAATRPPSPGTPGCCPARTRRAPRNSAWPAHRTSAAADR